MGGAASKQARNVGSKTLQYPKRNPTAPSGLNSIVHEPQVHGAAEAAAVRPAQDTISRTKDQRIRDDGQDPHFLANLRQLGAVDVNALSPHKPLSEKVSLSTSILQNRSKINDAATADHEDYKRQHATTDIHTIRDILESRKKGKQAEKIAKEFGLEVGVVEKVLGGRVNVPTHVSPPEEKTGRIQTAWVESV
ncbi:hypothetical protein YB2330_004158 [Saitoella coloradoensis]